LPCGARKQHSPHSNTYVATPSVTPTPYLDEAIIITDLFQVNFTMSTNIIVQLLSDNN
jgi:hypothetical protein